MSSGRGKLAAAALACLLLAAAAEAEAAQVGRNIPERATCSALDESQVQVAEETGGRVIPSSPSGLAANADGIGRLLAASVETLLLARGELATGAGEWRVPVDASMSRLDASLCIDAGDAELLRPDGRAVDPIDPDVSSVGHGGFRILAVADPAVGEWRIRIRGAGRYLAWVHGVTTIENGESELVEEIEPFGWVEATSPPVMDRVATFRIRLRDPLESLQLELRDHEGAVLTSAAATALHGGSWVADLAIPRRPFRVVLQGRDIDGGGVLRTQAATMQPSPVAIDTVDGGPLRAVPFPAQIDVALRVEHRGPRPRHFRFVATEPTGLELELSPQTADAEPGDAIELQLRFALEHIPPVHGTPVWEIDLKALDAHTGEVLGSRRLLIVPSLGDLAEDS